MDLSFRLVLRFEHLQGLSGYSRDITDLVRLGDHDHPYITTEFLTDYFARNGAFAIACDRTGVVGVSWLWFEKKGSKLSGEISSALIKVGYSRTKQFHEGSPGFSVSRFLYAMLMSYAKKVMCADEVNVRDRPGHFTRYGYDANGHFVRIS